MIETMRRTTRRWLRNLKAGALVDAYRKGTLVDEGWYESFKTLQAVDANGEPLPWYTYGFIHFLEPRLDSGFRVFEYGCGNSTRWYSKRVGEIVSVEHDREWAARVERDLASPSRVILREPGETYVQEIASHGRFNIVVVDGIEELRPACAAAASDVLTDDGVIIWDNSDRPEFAAARPTLAGRGFRQLAWQGLGPTSIVGWETSVLYREHNCLGI